MMVVLLLALSVPPKPVLPPIEDQQAVRITLEKLQSLRDRLSQRRASDNDLAEQETRMVATLEDLEFALSEAKRAARLAAERLTDSDEHLDELEAQSSGLEQTAAKARQEARAALGLLLRGNHVGVDKPLLRAFERQRVARSGALWRRAEASALELADAVSKVETIRYSQKRLKEDLDSLLNQRAEVRRLAEVRLQEVRRDRRRAEAHAKALEQQRLALAAWLAQIKPMLNVPHGGLKRGGLVPPVAGKVVKGYGWQEAKDRLTRWRNRGIDLEGLSTAPVVAAAEGRVAFVGRSPGLGLAMVIDHGRGWRTIYGGLSETQAMVGDDLKAGSVIGLLGDSGVLHFELRSDALAVNPTRWFQGQLGGSKQ
jgi:murein DD-endopeptidase MepM/ murein hydrolase activator NlpD